MIPLLGISILIPRKQTKISRKQKYHEVGDTSKYVMCIYLMEYYTAIKMVIRRKVATWEIFVLMLVERAV